MIFPDELIKAIHDDIKKSKAALDLPENAKYKSDPFFNETSVPA